ncbi:hypothetical protein MPSEU_000439900 [Mayamaea pseudoterrestris]|nr:hypothetical protein MPSEU_000439900 [Mayamaea pseudoterrestris]
MESIQHEQISTMSTSACCSSARETSKMNSATKALVLLICATVLGCWSRLEGSDMTERCSPPKCTIKSGPISLVAALTGTAPTQSSSTSHNNNINFPLRPIIAELGVIALFQVIGFPAIGRAGVLLRRVKLMRLGRSLHVPAPLLRQLSRQAKHLTRVSTKVWKTAETVYSKTSLSKLVQRIKKMLKIFSHAHEEEELEASASHTGT